MISSSILWSTSEMKSPRKERLTSGLGARRKRSREDRPDISNDKLKLRN